MSLKTKITAIIWGSSTKDAAIISEKIIKEIEKRIDSKIQEMERNERGYYDDLKRRGLQEFKKELRDDDVL